MEGGKVTFVCKCGETHTKTVRAMKTGALCRSCMQTRTAILRIKNRIAINEAMLKIAEKE